MSGEKSISKGKRAEQELVKLFLSVGIKCTRKVRQNKDDLDLEFNSHFPFSVESKRRSRAITPRQVLGWWEELVPKAEANEKYPVLAWRQDAQPWQFMFPLYLLQEFHSSHYTYSFTVDWPIATMLFRRFLEDESFEKWQQVHAV